MAVIVALKHLQVTEGTETAKQHTCERQETYLRVRYNWIENCNLKVQSIGGCFFSK